MLIKANFINAKVTESDAVKVFFTVSKKVAKLAVQRNKLKRMGRLALRDYIANIKNASIQFYFTSIPQDQSEVEEDISQIMQKIR
jgi:ribonuclease P protein component